MCAFWCWRHYGMRPGCLPRHPAVAYLFLLRPMADAPPFEKKTEQLLVFLQNQVLELQRENLQHKATLTALEHYVLRLLHSESSEPKEKLMKNLVEMVRQIHHGFLENLET